MKIMKNEIMKKKLSEMKLPQIIPWVQDHSGGAYGPGNAPCDPAMPPCRTSAPTTSEDGRVT